MSNQPNDPKGRDFGPDTESETVTHNEGRRLPPHKQIGPYRILELLGEGGMGEVWLAEQSVPVKRKVALKVIKQGMDTKQVVARFEAEEQALALMDHPAIAKVYDAGATPEGRPYFVMEYVQGVPITEHCDRHRLTNRERLDLFKQVCEAVQHAHQKAVIHRDLKPANVLVSIQDGKPLPRIIDFGVAKATGQKLTEHTMHTQLGVMLGTPAYMSPEQAEMTGQNVDTRTDIYALGVMLYELLVGALPFDMSELQRAGFEAIARKIREEEPPRPSVRLATLGDHSTEAANHRMTGLSAWKRELTGELDWIVLRAMEKNRERRYGTASEFAKDIARYLDGSPVDAAPPSGWYQLRKLLAKHRQRVIVWSAVLLVAGAALPLAWVISFVTDWAISSRFRTGVVHEWNNREREYLGMVTARDVAEFQIAIDRQDYVALPELIDSFSFHLSHNPWSIRHLLLRAQIGAQSSENYQGGFRRARVHDSPIRTLTFADQTGVLESVSEKGQIARLDPTSLSVAERGQLEFPPAIADPSVTLANVRQEILMSNSIPGSEREIVALAYSADGHILAVATPRTVSLWRLTSGELTLEFEGEFDDVGSLAICTSSVSDFGYKVYVGSARSSVYRWDPTDPTEWHRMYRQQSVWRTASQDSPVLALACHEDARTLATGSADGRIQVWDTGSGIEQLRLHKQQSPITSVAWSADGNWLASGDARGYVILWDAIPASMIATTEQLETFKSTLSPGAATADQHPE